jgi:quinol monooxygenase YgiN
MAPAYESGRADPAENIACLRRTEDSEDVPVAPPGALPRYEGGGVVYARSTTIDARPDAVSEGIAYVRNEVVPALHEIDGCVGLSLLTDRESGRCITTSAWASAEAMHASADRARWPGAPAPPG